MPEQDERYIPIVKMISVTLGHREWQKVGTLARCWKCSDIEAVQVLIQQGLRQFTPE